MTAQIPNERHYPMTIFRTLTAAVLVAAVASGCVAESSGDDLGDAAPAAGPATDSGNTDNPPPEDLNADLSCRADSLGWAVASGTLTNQSSGLSSYIISVNFADDAGTIYANGTAFVNDVPAGATAAWEAQSFTDSQGGTCTVTEVNRFAA